MMAYVEGVMILVLSMYTNALASSSLRAAYVQAIEVT